MIFPSEFCNRLLLQMMKKQRWRVIDEREFGENTIVDFIVVGMPKAIKPLVPLGVKISWHCNLETLGSLS